MHKILLVEDDPSLREVYTLILSTEPYQVDTASNGKQALSKCTEHTYNLILLDLMMPILDGVGFLKRFASLPHPGTNVIILSNLSEGRELARALKIHAYPNVLKADLSPRQLLTVVRDEIKA